MAPIHSAQRRASSVPIRSTRKKALVVGIRYLKQSQPESREWEPLAGPHKDANSFSRLLVEKYNFKEDDIVLMLDDGRQGLLEPTRVNLIRQLRMLVESPQVGDEFVFYFAGHSDQIPNRTNSEDDGKDEALMPVDHRGTDDERYLIRDNFLRKMLVSSLPRGTRLAAIFDSCHSGTMLDLSHYNCHKIESRKHTFEKDWEKKFPRRRDADDKHMKPIQSDNPHEAFKSRRFTIRRAMEAERKEDGDIQVTEQACEHSTPDVRRMNSLMGMPGPAPPPSPHTSVGEPAPGSRKSSTTGLRRRSRSLSPHRMSQDAPSQSNAIQRPQQSGRDRMNPVVYFESEEDKQCVSPTTTVRECSEKCKFNEANEDEETADIISLAACRDRQLTYEDCRGNQSFTDVSETWRHSAVMKFV
ncbi:hypothetical protein CERSUDRAFT_88192 [Gelatoporia subvermispora B]|uniref:Peptidase C14 caspase domain-containing protein n=1 Tax=Ceriporiopsis subvermispora (strain B) TaxID=914234 RepID=M2R048_CERS8|nr:hypothetical protein CERSUDRAFT_88192 [Gelatoporia subvermispora B]